jgi:signal transduction histidine kinase
LYIRFYLALLGSLVAFALIAGLAWHLGGAASVRMSDPTSRLVLALAPSSSDSAGQQHDALQRMAEALQARVTLVAADQSPIATAAPAEDRSMGAAVTLPAAPLMGEWSVRLADGREVRVASTRASGHSLFTATFIFLVLALAVGAAAFPIMRRMARRLERLQQGVEALGEGNLAVRVPVEGRDEVAQLASSFNQASARIEKLVGAHKALLANASHELRTPLARIRMAAELMKSRIDPQHRAGLDQDINELDALIDEILLASRLDAIAELQAKEDVDVLALAAEECARFDDVTLTGDPVTVRGDSRLLRRMIRNLLENAQRHGEPPVELRVTAAGHEASIVVSDAGEPIRDADHERLFEPFYRRPGSVYSTGVGLGLSLVRQIARHHGGTVCCVSTAEAGNGFVVTLPTSLPPA